MKNILLIFCDDFRIKDNPALSEAAAQNANIIPLFVYDENYLGRKIGAASKVFLHHLLISFSQLLKSNYNCNLVIRSGDSLLEIEKILSELAISSIYLNESYIAAQIDFVKTIRKKYKQIEIKTFKAKLLFRPTEIKTKTNEYFKVFTPFAKECLKNIALIGQSIKMPKALHSKHNLRSLQIEDLKLLPSKKEGNWPSNIASSWEFDYNKIATNLINFFDNKLLKYSSDRNNAAINGTSNISPYLRFGVISPRNLFYEASNREASQQFILEILWREFAYHVNFFHQNLATKEVKDSFKNFQWLSDEDSDFQLWCKARTGFEIVDAGMIELARTGFMHNRVRMITASFLIKDLIIDWRKGEQWFWDYLVDADAAINPFSWQWVFGSGFDAAPYFRIFNPDLQKEKFDKNGDYCKKWLPKDYNLEKILDHNVRRKIALEIYKKTAKT